VTPQEIVCREFVEVVTEYLDDALPADRLELVEEHLVMCDWCRDYLEQIETTAAVASQAAPAGPPEEVLRDLMAAFRERHSGGAS